MKITILQTQAIIDFVTKNECFWFLDVIKSYQTLKLQQEQPFQVWIFRKNEKGNGCVVTCEDGNGNVVIKQKIQYTDCPQQEFKFWLENNLIYLPSEH